MRIERHDDPATFFARVAPFLERREAEHNLQLGFRARLEADRHAFGPADPLLYAALDDRGGGIYSQWLTWAHHARPAGCSSRGERGRASDGGRTG